jgi:hypothetical protein
MIGSLTFEVKNKFRVGHIEKKSCRRMTISVQQRWLARERSDTAGAFFGRPRELRTRHNITCNIGGNSPGDTIAAETLAREFGLVSVSERANMLHLRKW